ncbi:MAG: FAD-dependent oxidoreductase [Oscillospiraceae bacterium]
MKGLISCMMNYPHLFSPFTIKKTTFKNRIFASPVSTDRGVFLNGVPTEQAINALENRARGGVAQVTVTETPVDYDRACRHDHAFNLTRGPKNSYHEQSLSVATEAIKVHGAVASIELAHTGALNHPFFINGKNPIGPTGYVREDGVTVDEMTEADMNEVADNFAETAYQAKRYGFDMIMVHGGHGWIFTQFTSPLTNKRTDKYGGSMENRARFPIMVLDRIRERCGEDFLIEYRLSADEMVPGGLTIDDTIEFISYIKDKIDILNVSAGHYHDSVVTGTFPSLYHKPGCHAHHSEMIKRAYPDLPVTVVGGINDPQLAEDIIASGKADFVGLGRQMLADPEFALKAMTGRADEIAPCLRCSCFTPMPVDPNVRMGVMAPRPFECTVNPRSLRELRLQTYPAPKARRKVLVIGGGCAGMYAAITAAERGHKTILVEKTGRLGGMLYFTETDSYKEDLRRYRDSLITRVSRLPIDLRMNTEATRELIEFENPYKVIVAVGASPIVPPIPGIENAAHALLAYDDPGAVGKRVVMIGGGLVGCETALHLAAKGHEVMIVEMLPEVAPDAFLAHKQAIIHKMEKELKGVFTETKCTRVEKNGIWAADRDGNEKFFEADTVLYAAGMRANTEIVDSLRGAVDNFEVVGDCRKPLKVLQAVRDAYFAAMDVI